MNSDLKTDDIRMQLREKLNADQIKLWLPPYFLEEAGSCEDELQNLASKYSSDLKVDTKECFEALKQLQVNACERLQERERYQNSGVATLKIRMPGESRFTSIPTALTCSVEELQEKVANRLEVVPDRIKLIWNGQVLSREQVLDCIGLKNGSQLMAVLLNDDQEELEAVNSRYKMLEATRADAKLLAGRSDNHRPYVQIADQSGKPLELPKAEKQALIIAMSLHEKGRAAAKQEDYALALVLFLKADEEFGQCQSRILESVDNYALLNLDIAWCYLCLGSVTQLPDAEKRLRVCEQNFHKSYGPNLERLIAIKGSTGNEAALFMRLHLLQAVVLFHQNKRPEAARLFGRVESELAALRVSDTNIATLLELGYTVQEARLGLRATHGDVNAAAEFVTRQRQERADREAKERAERLLGRCDDDKQWVDPGKHRSLAAMGFSSSEARAALQAGNNDMDRALHLLQDKDSLLRSATARKMRILPDWVQQVVAVGFDPRMARLALRNSLGDVEKAVEELLSKGGVIEDNNSESDSDPEAGETSQKQRKARAQEQKAYKRLAEGMAVSETDHLDLTLEAEEAFLHQYQALL